MHDADAGPGGETAGRVRPAGLARRAVRRRRVPRVLCRRAWGLLQRRRSRRRRAIPRLRAADAEGPASLPRLLHGVSARGDPDVPRTARPDRARALQPRVQVHGRVRRPRVDPGVRRRTPAARRRAQPDVRDLRAPRRSTRCAGRSGAQPLRPVAHAPLRAGARRSPRAPSAARASVCLRWAVW